MFGNLFSRLNALPLLAKVLLGLVALGMAVFASPLAVAGASVVLIVAVLAVLVRLVQRRPLRTWGFVALASLVLIVVFAGISSALYPSSQSPQAPSPPPASPPKEGPKTATTPTTTEKTVSRTTEETTTRRPTSPTASPSPAPSPEPSSEPSPPPAPPSNPQPEPKQDAAPTPTPPAPAPEPPPSPRPEPAPEPPAAAPLPPSPNSTSGSIPPLPGGECPNDAPIKGNASSHIYHVPGGAYYSKTKAEQCFATEQDAQNAGYRKSQR